MIYRKYKEDFVPSLHDTIYTKEQWVVVVRGGHVSYVKSFEIGDYVFVFNINTNTKSIKKSGYVGKIIGDSTLEFIEASTDKFRMVVDLVVKYIRDEIDIELHQYNHMDTDTREYLIKNIFRLKSSIESSTTSKSEFVDVTKTSWSISQILSTKTITILDSDFNILNGIISNIKYPFYMVRRLDNYVTITKIYSDKICKIYDPLSSRPLTKEDIFIINKIQSAGLKLFFYDNDIETLMVKNWSKFPWVLDLINKSTQDPAYKEILRNIFTLTNSFRYNKSSEFCILSILSELSEDIRVKYSSLLSKDIRRFSIIVSEPRTIKAGNYTITLSDTTLSIIGGGINTGHKVITLQDVYDFIYACLGSEDSEYLISYDTEIEELYYGWVVEKSSFVGGAISEFGALMEESNE